MSIGPLHQTNLRQAASCLALFDAVVNKGLRPVFAPFAVGTAGHAIVEALYRDSVVPGDRRRRDVAWEALVTWWEGVTDEPVSTFRQAAELCETIIGSRLEFAVGNAQMDVEHGWEMDEGFRALPHPATRSDEEKTPAYAGRMDCITWGDWGVRVEDWKSQRSFPKKDDLYFDPQARLYSLAAMAMFPGVDRVTFRLTLLRHSFWQDVEFVRGDPWERETKGWMRALRRRIMAAEASGEWPATVGDGCSLCPVAERCGTLTALRAQGAMPENLSDEDVARGHLALHRLAQSYEREARDRAETRDLPAGDGFVLAHVPAKDRHVLAFSVSVVLDELRAMGATTEDCARFFPGDRITTRALRTALEEMGERGLLGHESPADTYTTFITTTPSTRFTRRAFTTEEQEK